MKVTFIWAAAADASTIAARRKPNRYPGRVLYLVGMGRRTGKMTVADKSPSGPHSNHGRYE